MFFPIIPKFSISKQVEDKNQDALPIIQPTASEGTESTHTNHRKSPTSPVFL